MTIVERRTTVTRQTMTRIPTPNGEYLLALYAGSRDDKEHMALVVGDVAGHDDVLIRVHSECFTGDVLGSLRCDCGEQLDRAMKEISARGRGVILYLRQEGRGIGLLEKLRAYNLQDLGHDTVDANLLLGHEADARDYTVAAQILEDLKVRSVQVMTNNPLKISALQQLGVNVTRRVPIEVAPGPDNLAYLQTKATRMSHLLQFNGADADRSTGGLIASGNGHHTNGNGHHNGSGAAESLTTMPAIVRKFTRPAVTISYAQALDGSIANPDGSPALISGKQSMTMTHRMRASHDAILVGIGTALADDPRLTVRLVHGDNPQPVIIDSHLRLDRTARVFQAGHNSPWIVTTDEHDPDKRRALEQGGAIVLVADSDSTGRVDLVSALDVLGFRGISSLMVEGGSGIIRSFLQLRLVDQLVVTLSPQLIGGPRVTSGEFPALSEFPTLSNIHYQRLGDDIVLWGRPQWETV